MISPSEILEEFNKKAEASISNPFTNSEELRKKIEFICRCNANKAPIRFLMSCLLAKLHNDGFDIRKPYTEIAGNDSYSGRYYDENYIEAFVHKHKLPCNPTTAYLTPAFRNIDRILTTDLVLVGRPREVYTYTLHIIDLVYNNPNLLVQILLEIIRFLIIIREEISLRMNQLIDDLKQSQDILPLSSDEILTLLSQHLSSKHASRLPVLIVASAYLAVSDRIGEKSLPLESHNAADKQTGSLGDVEIILTTDDKIISCYEMKDKKVSKNDIIVAMAKLSKIDPKPDNYIFITTETIDEEVSDYAKSLYEQLGIEFAIFDCIGFIRHYLHFFHRTRITFLNTYQELLLAEPSSAVSQPLKEAFLALRRAAESSR